MKKNNYERENNWYEIVLIAMIFALSFACGGSSSDSSSAAVEVETKSVSGVISDPAIENATINLMKLNGESTELSATSDSSGKFTIEGITGELSEYKVVSTGGTDVETGESFDGLEMSAPLTLFGATDAVISPLTTLVTEAMGADVSNKDSAIASVKAKVGDVDVTKDPTTDAMLQEVALKVTLLRKMGSSASDVLNKLDDTAGIDSADIDSVYSDDEMKAKAKYYLENLADTTKGSTIISRYTDTRVKKKILDTIEGSSLLNDKTDVVKNLDDITNYIAAMNTSGKATTDDFVIQVITQEGSVLKKENLMDSNFDVTSIPAISSDVNLTFDDTLKKAFYTVDNSETGNKQLLAYDADTDKSELVKSDVIIGDKTFVFRGIKIGDKTVIKERKYGLYLDPTQAKETRTGSSRGVPYEYSFYANNVIKKFSVLNPSEESVFFGSTNVPSSLNAAGINKVGAYFGLENTMTDVDNSYIYTSVYEKLADSVQGEVSGDQYQAPVIVRVSDSKSAQGKLISTIKDSSGKVTKVLVNYVAIHKNGEYPKSGMDATTERKRLQVLEADLSGATDVTGADGSYKKVGESTSYIYLVKEESKDLYAFSKAELTLSMVSGDALPGGYDPSRHFMNSGGHGDTASVLSNFSSLDGMNHTVSEGEAVYLAVNYDLDLLDTVGSMYFGTDAYPQKIYKHAAIYKLSGLTSTKLFDNGDGIEHGDSSDEETGTGHVSLVAVKNGALVVETAIYSIGFHFTGATDALSHEVQYGILDTMATTSKTSFDKILKSKGSLPYLTARRMPAIATGAYLFLNMYESSDENSVHTYKVSRFKWSDLENPVSEYTGRTYFIKKGVRANGTFDGTVFAWNETEASFTEVVNNVTIGNTTTVAGKALDSFVAEISNPPTAGQGSVGVLRGDNDISRSYFFVLFAFKPGAKDSLKLAYAETSANWIVE